MSLNRGRKGNKNPPLRLNLTGDFKLNAGLKIFNFRYQL